MPYLPCPGRWVRSSEYAWRRDAHEYLKLEFTEQAPASFITGRSACPNCDHPLSGVELIPIVSFLVNRGRCAHCDKKISIRYPFIELITLAALLPLYYLPLSLVVWAIHIGLICSLLLACIVDLEHQWIPDESSAFAAFFAFALLYFKGEAANIYILAGVASYTLVAALRLIFLWTKNVEAIGLGDAKLLAALVFWLGPSALSPILLIASLSGIAFHIITRKHRLDKMPFGPFLIFSALLMFYLRAFQ